jgi:hypothetical protein
MAVFKNAVGIPDQDAINFINATGITNPTQIGAINRLVLDLKGFLNPNYPTTNIWDKMKAVYPFIGQPEVSSSFQFNLKNTNTFKATFSGEWTFASTGVKGNNIDTYINTQLIPSLEESTNLALGGYIRTNIGNTFGSIFGLVNNGAEYFLAGNWTQVNRPVGKILGDIIIGSNVELPGFFQVSRENNASLVLKRNQSVLGSSTSTASPISVSIPLWIGSENRSSGVSTGKSIPDEIAFAYISSGLSNLEMDNLYTAVQRFQTTLGRQV